MKLSRTIAIVLAVSLLISGFVHIALFRLTVRFYRELQTVRLDPTNSRRFTASNAGIPELLPGQARIVFFGDSRIARWDPLPSLSNCQSVNRGVSGETTAQAVLRLDRDVIGLGPSIVVVQAGINDLKAIGLFADRADEIVNSCFENLKTIVSRAVASDIHVVILTVFRPGPVDLLRRPVWSREIGPAVEAINGMIRTLNGPGVTVVDSDSILVVGRRINPEYTLDTLHLTAAGYERFNTSIEPLLQGLLAQQGRVKSEK
ncbi:MAG: hypothetical protein JSU70_23360 [Phycisphaerales bacterium]|nr:MAG: hypothetical protein JSU70_23360 [Phycisphaerales bacterium]